MWKDRFKGIRSYLQTRFDDDLRWIAIFDSDDYEYDVRYVRDDLKNQLSGNQLDFVIHRSMAVFSRQHIEEVYFHLGEADHLVSGYESGTAYHVYFEHGRGVVVMLEPDASVDMPGFVDDVRSKMSK